MAWKTVGRPESCPLADVFLTSGVLSLWTFLLKAGDFSGSVFILSYKNSQKCSRVGDSLDMVLKTPQ